MKGGSRKQTQSTNKIVDKLCRVRIANRQYQRVIELKFFGRAISNDQSVEKEIKIQRVAVQLTDGAGQNLCVHRGESQFQFQLLRTRTQSIINNSILLNNSNSILFTSRICGGKIYKTILL